LIEDLLLALSHTFALATATARGGRLHGSPFDRGPESTFGESVVGGEQLAMVKQYGIVKGFVE